MKRLLILINTILLSVLFSVFFTQKTYAQEPVEVKFFALNISNECHEAEAYLNSLQGQKNIKLVKYDILDKENLILFDVMLSNFGLTQRKVPFIVIENQYWQGWDRKNAYPIQQAIDNAGGVSEIITPTPDPVSTPVPTPIPTAIITPTPTPEPLVEEYGTQEDLIKNINQTPVVEEQTQEEIVIIPENSEDNIIPVEDLVEGDNVIESNRIAPDVPNDHKYLDGIRYVYRNGIVNGYSDGNFRPENKISRAEFIKIVVNTKHSEDRINYCTFSRFLDISTQNKFVQYICLAERAKIIDGYNDGEFKPDRFVTFGEASKILANTFLDPDESKITLNEKFKVYIQSLEEKGAILPSIQHQDYHITRAEMAEMIYRIVENVTNKEYIMYKDLINIVTVDSGVTNSLNEVDVQCVDNFLDIYNIDYLNKEDLFDSSKFKQDEVYVIFRDKTDDEMNMVINEYNLFRSGPIRFFYPEFWATVKVPPGKHIEWICRLNSDERVLRAEPVFN